jgi:hypothetical protein
MLKGNSSRQRNAREREREREKVKESKSLGRGGRENGTQGPRGGAATIQA